MIHCKKHKIEYGYEPCPMCRRDDEPAVDYLNKILVNHQTINSLIELNDSLAKENSELKRQIEIFTKAEIWGADAANYEGEYNGK